MDVFNQLIGETRVFVPEYSPRSYPISQKRPPLYGAVNQQKN
jgi:hypothetical protein